MAFEYPSLPVRDEIREAHRGFWAALAKPGAWWTGAERLAMAAATREARPQRATPPWLREATAAREGELPEAALAAVRRIAIDAHRLDRAWCEEVVAALGPSAGEGAAAFVELVAVTVCTTAIDQFAEALGLGLEPLPDAEAGEPSRVRPDGVGDAGAWVEMTVPYAGPNVGRALSLAPSDHMAFMRLVGSMYALRDFTELVWKERALSRPQVELVASRVSSLNECFY